MAEKGALCEMSHPIKVAAIHAAPVLLDRAATTAKAISINREAARAGAQLVAFRKHTFPRFRCGPRCAPQPKITI